MKYIPIVIMVSVAIVLGTIFMRAKNKYEVFRDELNTNTYTIKDADGPIIEKLLKIPVVKSPVKLKGLADGLKGAGYTPDIKGLCDCISFIVPEWQLFEMGENKLNAMKGLLKANLAPVATYNTIYVTRNEDGTVMTMFHFYMKGACEYKSEGDEIILFYRNDAGG